MEHEPSGSEYRQPKNDIEIPEVPLKETYDFEDSESPNSTPEAWQKWVDFARSDFAMTKIWADTEYKRVQQEMYQDRIARGEFMEGSDAYAKEDLERWQKYFNLLAEGSLKPEMLPGGKENMMDRSWWFNTVNSIAQLLNTNKAWRDQAMKHCQSREALFNFFVDEDWNRHRGYLVEKNLDPDKYRAMFRPNWEAELKPQDGI